MIKSKSHTKLKCGEANPVNESRTIGLKQKIIQTKHLKQ